MTAAVCLKPSFHKLFKKSLHESNKLSFHKLFKKSPHESKAHWEAKLEHAISSVDSLKAEITESNKRIQATEECISLKWRIEIEINVLVSAEKVMITAAGAPG